MNSSSSWITEDHLPSVIWRLALPMMGASVLQDAFAIADMYFVGKLGSKAIGAVTIGGTIMGILFMLVIGVISGCTALVALAFGGGKKREAELVLGQSLTLSILLSAVAAAAAFYTRDILTMFGAGPDVLDLGSQYLSISLGGSAGLILAVTLSSALRGAGDAVTPLWVIGLGNVANIILDPLLIFGYWGFPELGVAGSAYATVISRVASTLLLGFIIFGGGHKHFAMKLRYLVPRISYIWRILRIGIFGSGQMLVRNLSALALVRTVTLFGHVPLAAYGIGIRLRMIVMMPGFGIGNAAATLVGQNMGAGREDRAVRSGWIATGMYVLICIAATIVGCVFPQSVLSIFTKDAAVVETGVPFMRWFSATFVFLAVSIVLGRSMSGAGDTLRPMIIAAVAMLVIRVPLSFVLSMQWESASGVWVGMAVSNIIQGLLFMGAFAYGAWKDTARKKRKPEPEPA